MAPIRRFLARLVNVFRPARSERDLDREVAGHLGLLEDEYRRRGLTEVDARRAARRALGGVAQAKERHRDARSFRWLNDLRKDTRFAVRALFRAPAFAAAAIATIALGIGANTAVFSVVHAVLLRGLPYPEADRFVRLAIQFEPDDGSGTKTYAAPVSFPDLQVLRSRARTLSNLGTYTPMDVTLSGRGEAVHLSGVRISPDVMAMLDATPLVGRLLRPGEEVSGLDRVAVISYAMWRRQFGGDDRILGTPIVLDDIQYEVVGVMRPGFQFPDADAEFWTPFVWSPQTRPVVVGRMNPGASLETASVEVDSLLGMAAAQRRSSAGPPPPGPPPPSGPRAGPPPPPGPGAAPPPGGQPGRTAAARSEPVRPRFIVVSLTGELVAGARTPLLILWAAVGFVLLIACVNVGGLLLARVIRREREIWVRLALGASRGRVVRQLVTESLLLTLVGGLVGVWFAAIGVRWLRTLGTALPRQDLWASSVVPRLDEVGVDGTVLLFALGVSVIAGLACGLAPAMWQSRAHPGGELAREAGLSAPGVNLFRRSRGRAALVVVQIGLTVILLLGSGLLIRSFLKLSSVNPGYATTRVLTFQLALPPNQRALALSADLIARIQALPGVRAAGYADHLPLTRSNLGHVMLSTRSRTGQSVVPPPPPPPGAVGKPDFPVVHIVSRTFLTALGIAVVEGRGFSDADPAGQPHSLLINRTLARSGFLGEHPIGTRVYTGGDVPWDVIGIVEDARETGLADPPGPEIFASIEQSDATDLGTLFRYSSPYFAVRADSAPSTLIPEIRRIVTGINPQIAPDRIATMDEIISNSILEPRFYAHMLGLFAGIAGTLAIVGIYGGIAFAVSRRTREVGIRMALGASKAQVFRAIVGDMLLLAAVGIVVGVAGGAMLTRYLERMLFDLTPLDPAVFIAIPVILAVAVLATALISARPALTVAPLAALRHE